MSYTAYYERRQKIGRREAQELEMLLQKQDLPAGRNVITRRLKFESSLPEEGEGKYSVYMLDFDENQIYLEFKYVQRGITYRKLAEISKKECLYLLEGDIAWMAGHKEKLCQDFYRQAGRAALRPGTVIETYKTVYRRGNDYICLKRSVRSIRSDGYKFFDPDIYMIRCLDYGEVELNEKRAVTIPRYIGSVLHGAEEEREDGLAFVL